MLCVHLYSMVMLSLSNKTKLYFVGKYVIGISLKLEINGGILMKESRKVESYFYLQLLKVNLDLYWQFIGLKSSFTQ